MAKDKKKDKVGDRFVQVEDQVDALTRRVTTLEEKWEDAEDINIDPDHHGEQECGDRPCVAEDGQRNDNAEYPGEYILKLTQKQCTYLSSQARLRKMGQVIMGRDSDGWIFVGGEDYLNEGAGVWVDPNGEEHNDLPQPK